MTLTFGTLCSGIEAASEAFLPLGAECRYVSEIEPFPCAVLADRHGAGKPMRMPIPEEAADEDDRREREAAIKAINRFPRWGNRIPNFGDLTQIDPDEVPEVDLLVAGFPCQDFSIAGLRASLDGARGNLTLYGVKLIHELVRRKRLRSVLLEQVPDILNTKDNAFGALLGGLVGHDAPLLPGRRRKWGYAGVADGPFGTAVWRVLDAQYAGLAQRRERLFLVGSFGDGPDPVEVLLERQGLSRDPPPRRKAGEGATHALAPSLTASGRGVERTGESCGQYPVVAVSREAFGGNNTAGPVDLATARTASHTASGRQDFETETFVVEPVAFNARQDPDVSGDITHPLDTNGHTQAIAFSCKDHGADAGELSPTMRAMGHGKTWANAGGQAAVAFSLRGREDGAMPEVEDGDVSPGLRAAEGGSTRPFVAFQTNGSNVGVDTEIAGTLRGNADRASGSAPMFAGESMAVRRITCFEAEALQGFRPGYTLIDWPTANRKGRELEEFTAYLIWHGYSPEEASVLAQCPDGPRYKAIGNSKPVPIVQKIGLAYAEALTRYLAGRAA